MSITDREMGLAGYVALRLDDWEPKHGCAAWVESRGSTCSKDLIPNTALCKRHRIVAAKRHQKKLETMGQQQAERKAYREKMLPEWKAELVKVEADMERYGGIGINDRAAVGGASHPSIQRKQLQHLSDTNVQRMAKLSRRAQELREKIGDDW